VAKCGWRFMNPTQRALVRPGINGRCTTAWTLAKLSDATRWWRQRKPATWIAQQLGGTITKNAVIGMMHRRLRNDPQRCKPQHPTDRQAQARKNKPRKPGKVVTHVFAPQPKPPPMVVVLTDVARVTHHDLNNQHCRWPIGEPAEAVANRAPLYCGNPRLPGLPYCKRHSDRAFRVVSAFPRQTYPTWDVR